MSKMSHQKSISKVQVWLCKFSAWKSSVTFLHAYSTVVNPNMIFPTKIWTQPTSPVSQSPFHSSHVLESWQLFLFQTCSGPFHLRFGSDSFCWFIVPFPIAVLPNINTPAYHYCLLKSTIALSFYLSITSFETLPPWGYPTRSNIFVPWAA